MGIGTSAAMGTSTKNLDWGNRWCLRIGHPSDELSSDIKPTFLEPFGF